MCSHYQSVTEPARYLRHFGLAPPAEAGKSDVWPLYLASFIRRPLEAGTGDEAVPESEAIAGQFGLVPHWATNTAVARRTYNARSETAASKPSFRDAWRLGQRCIIPAEAFYEPDWRSGKAVPTRIASVDGEPLGIAGLWSRWKSADGAYVHSFTMLTVNADAHVFMRQYHRPDDEKRMVVVLPADSYQAWLTAPVERTMEFMRAYRSGGLVVSVHAPEHAPTQRPVDVPPKAPVRRGASRGLFDA